MRAGVGRIWFAEISALEQIARAQHGTLRVGSTTKDGTRFRATFEGAL